MPERSFGLTGHEVASLEHGLPAPLDVDALPMPDPRQGRGRLQTLCALYHRKEAVLGALALTAHEQLAYHEVGFAVYECGGEDVCREYLRAVQAAHAALDLLPLRPLKMPGAPAPAPAVAFTPVAWGVDARYAVCAFPNAGGEEVLAGPFPSYEAATRALYTGTLPGWYFFEGVSRHLQAADLQALREQGFAGRPYSTPEEAQRYAAYAT